MSETGGPEPLLNLDDVERALVLAREVAAATEHGGSANLRMAHLRELFSAGGPAPTPARMQLALTAAGLRVDPPLDTNPDSVSLKVLGDRAALAAQAPPKRERRPASRPARRRQPEPAGFEPDPTPPDHDFDEEPEPRRRVRHDDEFDDNEAAPRWGAAAYQQAAGLPDPEPPPHDADFDDDDRDHDPEAHGDFDDDEHGDEFDELDELDDEDDDEAVSAAEQAVHHQPALTDPHAPLTLGDMEKLLAARRAEDRTATLLAALLPALIIPALVAAFLGPIFGALFAGLAALTAATLSRPGALESGRIGPIPLPKTLPRAFLFFTVAIAVIALAAAVALSLAGGTDTSKTPETQPLQTQKQPPPSTSTQKQTTPPAPPQNGGSKTDTTP